MIIHMKISPTFESRNVDAEQQLATSSMTSPTGRLAADLRDFADMRTSNPPPSVIELV